MPILSIVVTLVVVGVVLWLINNYIPMQGTIKSILNVVVIICTCVWVLQVFGVLGNMSSYRIR